MSISSNFDSGNIFKGTGTLNSDSAIAVPGQSLQLNLGSSYIDDNLIIGRRFSVQLYFKIVGEGNVGSNPFFQIFSAALATPPATGVNPIISVSLLELRINEQLNLFVTSNGNFFPYISYNNVPEIKRNTWNYVHAFVEFTYPDLDLSIPATWGLKGVSSIELALNGDHIITNPETPNPLAPPNNLGYPNILAAAGSKVKDCGGFPFYGPWLNYITATNPVVNGIFKIDGLDIKDCADAKPLGEYSNEATNIFARASSLTQEVLTADEQEPNARMSQAVMEIISKPPNKAFASQLVIELLTENGGTVIRPSTGCRIYEA